MEYTGRSFPRVDAYSKVTGSALYPGDYSLPDQAYLKILFAPGAHGIIHKIDIEEANKIPGILGIFTASDVPINEYGLRSPDQPVLIGPDSRNPRANRYRFIGDQIAVIVAETETIATLARDTIQIEYEPFPVLDNPLESMQDKILLFPDKQTNVISKYKICYGDVEEGFKDSDVIIESEYYTPIQEHAFLQPEAGLGYIDEEGRITILFAGQWVHEDQIRIAHSLDLPPEKVRIIYAAVGGAFGGREEKTVQFSLALATYKLARMGIYRPVKIVWNRQESIIGHHKRHSFVIKAKWGANKQGKILAVRQEMMADGGAYAYTSDNVLANATVMATGPYEIPNVDVSSSVVYTNNIPCGAFRGYGGPQAAFAAEMQINKLAEALKIDPVEFRVRNLIKDGSILPFASVIPAGVSITEVVEKCAQQAGWKHTKRGWRREKIRNINPKSKKILKGVGFACALKNVGFSFGYPDKCFAKVELYGEERVEKVILRHAGAENGQGSHTAFLQMTATALGVKPEIIEMDLSDTSSSLNSGCASASRMTFMAGNSIIGAAQLALEKWNNEERPAIATHCYNAPKTTPMNPKDGSSIPNFAYGYVAEAAEIEVDTETGQIKIRKITCADDIGYAINPQQVEGQIEGGIVQTVGYSLMENFIQKDGYVHTDKLSTYLIPTILDIPDSIESILVQKPDPIGPWGARGMGEMPVMPLAPAIGGALYDATGQWLNNLPYLPEAVLKLFKRRNE